MRLLVFGGRFLHGQSKYLGLTQEFIENTLNQFKKYNHIDCVIEGNARGTDRIAGFWARKNKIENVKFNPDWDNYGNAAGPIRNQQMIDEGNPDFAIAFPGGKGTADMLSRIIKHEIQHKVIIIGN